jgi:hypothetical protein
MPELALATWPRVSYVYVVPCVPVGGLIVSTRFIAS